MTNAFDTPEVWERLQPQEILDFMNSLHELGKLNIRRRHHAQVKILDERLKEYPMPSRGSEDSAGIDLRCMELGTVNVWPGETRLVSTGLSIFIEDPELAGVILPRSGMGHKYGLVLGNLVGLVDADYQGPLKVSLWNRNKEGPPVTLNPGDRIAQFVLIRIAQLEFKIVEQFDNRTDRAEGGFGSSGR